MDSARSGTLAPQPAVPVQYSLLHLANLNYTLPGVAAPAVATSTVSSYKSLPSWQLVLAPWSVDFEPQLHSQPINRELRRRREIKRGSLPNSSTNATASTSAAGGAAAVAAHRHETPTSLEDRVFSGIESLIPSFPTHNLDELSSAQLALIRYHPAARPGHNPGLVPAIVSQAEDVFFARRESDLDMGVTLQSALSALGLNLDAPPSFATPQHGGLASSSPVPQQYGMHTGAPAASNGPFATPMTHQQPLPYPSQPSQYQLPGTSSTQMPVTGPPTAYAPSPPSGASLPSTSASPAPMASAYAHPASASAASAPPYQQSAPQYVQAQVPPKAPAVAPSPSLQHQQQTYQAASQPLQQQTYPPSGYASQYAAQQPASRLEWPPQAPQGQLSQPPQQQPMVQQQPMPQQQVPQQQQMPQQVMQPPPPQQAQMQTQPPTQQVPAQRPARVVQPQADVNGGGGAVEPIERDLSPFSDDGRDATTGKRRPQGDGEDCKPKAEDLFDVIAKDMQQQPQGLQQSRSNGVRRSRSPQSAAAGPDASKRARLSPPSRSSSSRVNGNAQTVNEELRRNPEQRLQQQRDQDLERERAERARQVHENEARDRALRDGPQLSLDELDSVSRQPRPPRPLPPKPSPQFLQAVHFVVAYPPVGTGEDELVDAIEQIHGELPIAIKIRANPGGAGTSIAFLGYQFGVDAAFLLNRQLRYDGRRVDVKPCNSVQVRDWDWSLFREDFVHHFQRLGMAVFEPSRRRGALPQLSNGGPYDPASTSPDDYAQSSSSNPRANQVPPDPRSRPRT